VCHYAECFNAKCHSAKCRSAKNFCKTFARNGCQYVACHLFVTLNINECHYADCHILFILWLNDVMLCVNMMNVVLLNVVAPE
jgi:hypothetical protein